MHTKNMKTNWQTQIIQIPNTALHQGSKEGEATWQTKIWAALASKSHEKGVFLTNF